MSESEFGRILERNKKYEREWKIASWTAIVAIVGMWIWGKGGGVTDRIEGTLIGAAAGFAIGFFVSRKMNRNK
jgi:hypothetical protein